MNKFLKAGITALILLISPSIFCADKEGALSDVILDIKDAAPSRTLTIEKCILDFSTPNKIAASSCRIGVYLLSEKTNDTLDLVDIAYLTFEGIAAGSRSTPGKFGRLAHCFIDKGAVYTSFMQIAGSMEVAEHELTVLGNLQSCTAFVQQTIAKDLPNLLTKLNVSPEDQADIALLATVFTPMFSQLLHKAYTGAMNAAAAATQAADQIASGNCGCFSWCQTRRGASKVPTTEK